MVPLQCLLDVPETKLVYCKNDITSTMINRTTVHTLLSVITLIQQQAIHIMLYIDTERKTSYRAVARVPSLVTVRVAVRQLLLVPFNLSLVSSNLLLQVFY